MIPLGGDGAVYWVNPQRIQYINQQGSSVYIYFARGDFISFIGFVEDVVAKVEKWFAPEDVL